MNISEQTVVLITGASRGIGRAIAYKLAGIYDLVLCCKTNIQTAEKIKDDICASGGTARVLQFDVSNRQSCKEILEADIQKNGAYYGVVLNAGIVADNAFPAMTEDDWDSVLNCDLGSFYNVLQPLIMPMIRRRKDGRIVVISSVSGIIGNRGQVNYSAAKAGLIGAVKALAVELAKRKITVNAVAPGLIETEILNENLPIEEILKMIPAGRAGKAEEVADLVEFLISKKSSYITRQVFAINGGLC